MDSISQLALGAAIGVAVMGRRTALWKAASVGAICGTLPDLDVLIPHGDAIKNMTYHRAESHSLFYLSLFATPLLTWLVISIFRENRLWRNWAVAIWLILITHPLLDLMTIYGTQLGIPFTDHPFAMGSIFIIDPAYTLWLLLGVGCALFFQDRRGLVINALGLMLSTGYLCWSLLAQHYVLQEARSFLSSRPESKEQLIAVPMPFNTLVWRIVAIRPEGYLEGYYSFLALKHPIEFTMYPYDRALYEKVQHNWYVRRLAWFTQNFYSVVERKGHAILTDLRMGGEPCYIFQFDLGPIAQVQRTDDLKIGSVSQRFDMAAVLSWITNPDWTHSPWQCTQDSGR